MLNVSDTKALQVDISREMLNMLFHKLLASKSYNGR